MSDALKPAIDFVFPPRCPLCGAAVRDHGGVCQACWGELAIPGEPCCILCQRPFADGVDSESVCAPCMVSPPHHDGIAAATLYNDASRRLVLAFKHAGRIGLAAMMGRMMLGKLGQIGPGWIVVPVPLHRWRLWQRGFNQSVLLGREVARARGASVNPRRAPDMRGARILLVDDVLTSGATSTACVKALRRAGAERVVIACFARVLDEALPLT